MIRGYGYYFVAVSLSIVLSVEAFNNGRPQCRNPEDFVRGWGVKNIPKQYWMCTAFGQSELRDCESDLTFSEVYNMCTVPGAVLGEIDRPPLLACKSDEEIDLSGTPYCTKVLCNDGLVVYDPEGHPFCYRDTVNHIQLCPGAPTSAAAVGTQTCVRPQCDLAEYQSNRMFPSANPTEFYRCGNIDRPITFKCSPGLCYDAKHQVCVWPMNWINVCG